MMTAGKHRRLRRILRADGRATVVAFDHGATSGPMTGMEDPGKTLERVLEGSPDGILTTIGVADAYKELLAETGLIIRIDFPSSDLVPGPSDCLLLVEVEEAVRLGADAVILTAGPGKGVERTTMANFTEVGRQCDAYGMPFIAEMYPGGFNPPPEMVNIDTLKLSARMAAEWGADLLKMPYRPGYREVVTGTYKPILVLGGAKTSSVEEFLGGIRDAVACGAAGCAIGRNVWGHENPAGMVRALHALIHEEAELAEAMALLR